ncbi:MULTISPECIES: hypothetical protein [Catenuloplanes]|uniref:Uncharacterized protein n=1 Tax=Catenuloplanes niger TaxID=587534 RepID=A0AAE4CU37_9ACTN|nr:hypothetical protein [Catenuloplanes niger]MDR7321359.1 hypothetical protein [Catenuloplanes niger]
MPRRTTARRISLTAAFLGLAAGGTAACDADPPPRRPAAPYAPAPTPAAPTGAPTGVPTGAPTGLPTGAPTGAAPLGTRNSAVVPDGVVRTGIVGQGGAAAGSGGG